MSIILNGTTGITSTGITETSDGNVGINTSSPAEKLSVSGRVFVSGSGYITNPTGLVLGQYASNDVYIQKPSGANLSFWDSNTNAQVTIDSSGNVGIGTNAPAQKLHIDGNLLFENNKEIRFKDSGATQRTAIAMSSNDLNIGTSAGGNLKFYNGSSYTERARITSSGSLLVGRTSQIAAEKIAIYTGASGTNTAYLWYGETDDRSSVIFRHDRAVGGTSAKQCAFLNQTASEVGSISCTGSATSYNTSSDYRLKEDWVAVADASTRVNALKPVNFAWKADGSRVDGFLAHELAEVVPEAVTGEKDAVDAEGNPVYQGIDQSKLVPLLTAALQEALAKIEDLTARVVALEGQP